MLRIQSHRLHTALVTVDVALSGALLLAMLSVPRLSGLDAGENWVMTPSLLAVALVACLAWPMTLQQLGLYDSQRLIGLERVLGRLTSRARRPRCS